MGGKVIYIAGREIILTNLNINDAKSISLGDKLMYNFYSGEYRGVIMTFLEPREGNPTPRNCQIASARLEKIFRTPVVFILQLAPTFERQRLLDKDVYFVMAEKYANLPMFVALKHTTNKKPARELTPVAQYLLLYNLEIRSLNGLTAKDIAELMPYSYESVTLGITCLSDLNLCAKEKKGQRSKAIRFLYSAKELWEQAQGLLFNPVDKVIYCDDIVGETKYPVCGINALSHYTMLNPDPEKWIALTSKEYKGLQTEKKLIHPNEFDGNYIIELWKYPPVSPNTKNIEWVDQLSLALSLRNNDDPRVKKEVERMISQMKWTG